MFPLFSLRALAMVFLVIVVINAILMYVWGQ
jgi:hypothetical protein